MFKKIFILNSFIFNSSFAFCGKFSQISLMTAITQLSKRDSHKIKKLYSIKLWE